MLDNFKKEFLSETNTAKTFENTSVRNAVVSALEKIKDKAALEGADASSFITSLRRKVVI